MKRIEEMEYRLTADGSIASDMRLVASKAPLAEHREMRAFAALPKVVRALLATGSWAEPPLDRVWHSAACWERRYASCSEDCRIAREALAECGVDVG